jgi:hypothetical protein
LICSLRRVLDVACNFLGCSAAGKQPQKIPRNFIVLGKLLLIFLRFTLSYPIFSGNAAVISVTEYMCFCLNVANIIEFYSLAVMRPKFISAVAVFVRGHTVLQI